MLTVQEPADPLKGVMLQMGIISPASGNDSYMQTRIGIHGSHHCHYQERGSLGTILVHHKQEDHLHNIGSVIPTLMFKSQYTYNFNDTLELMKHDQIQ